MSISSVLSAFHVSIHPQSLSVIFEMSICMYIYTRIRVTLDVALACSESLLPNLPEDEVDFHNQCTCYGYNPHILMYWVRFFTRKKEKMRLIYRKRNIGYEYNQHFLIISLNFPYSLKKIVTLDITSSSASVFKNLVHCRCSK